MNKPTQIDLAWAAGFIDGEGYIGIPKQKPSTKNRQANPVYRLFLQVTNTKLEPLIRLQTLFGGSISHHTPKNKRGRIQHKWTIARKAAIECLPFILPHLSCKYEQAHLAIEFQRTIKQQGGHVTPDQLQFRELCCQRMRILNGKGQSALDRGLQEEIVTERAQKPKML